VTFVSLGDILTQEVKRNETICLVRYREDWLEEIRVREIFQILVADLDIELNCY
jgi:hypothetical protein